MREKEHKKRSSPKFFGSLFLISAKFFLYCLLKKSQVTNKTFWVVVVRKKTNKRERGREREREKRHSTKTLKVFHLGFISIYI